MTTPPRTRVPWSHWDKFLFIFLGIVVVLAVSVAVWFRGLDISPTVTIPTPVMPAQNAYDYFVAAGRADYEDKWASGKEFHDNSPAALAAKQQTLLRNTRAYALLHQGFQYSYQAPPTRSFSGSFDHSYAKDRNLARVLSLQANFDAQKGDWNGAVSAGLDCVQMGEQMPHGGTLIAMLVGTACENIGRRELWTNSLHLTGPEARAAAQRLEHIRAEHVAYADTLQEDEWTGQASLLEMMRRPDWPGGGWNSDGGMAGNFQNAQLATRTRLTGKRTIMGNYTHYMDQCIANARHPYAAHLPPPPVPSDPMNQMMLSNGLDNVRFNEARADTQNALLLTFLALHAYKLEHGAYPPTLPALVPGYLKAVPSDPLAVSGPLRYKVQGAKFVLYSVGPDGQDDGGQPIFDRTKPAPLLATDWDNRYMVMPDKKGDIVAGVNVY